MKKVISLGIDSR